MSRLSIIAGTGIVALAVVISMLVIVLPREKPAPATPSASGGRDFFAVPEKPRTDDGKRFKPDWD